MAGLDADPLASSAPRPHDGQARCCVCTDADASAEHEWCAAVSGLVCRTCCQRILLGDLGRVMAAAMGASEPCHDAAEALGPCAECVRGGRWLAQNALGLGDGRTMPS
jgi:hypothetical protein